MKNLSYFLSVCFLVLAFGSFAQAGHWVKAEQPILNGGGVVCPKDEVIAGIKFLHSNDQKDIYANVYCSDEMLQCYHKSLSDFHFNNLSSGIVAEIRELQRKNLILEQEKTSLQESLKSAEQRIDLIEAELRIPSKKIKK